VLSEPAPEQAAIRDQLRAHLAAHPGNPEKALAEHLSALRSLTGSSAGAPGVLRSVVPSEGQHRGETPGPAAAEAASRVQAILSGRLLLTAFQPISDLSTGAIVGVEAFTRFVSDGNDTAG
jgi:EAL domain-containing protein (putative c-di-GMP-specific phosphodiesterase class I)